MVKHERIWIAGATRSGKTSHLIRQFCQWAAQTGVSVSAAYPPTSPPRVGQAPSSLLSSTELPGILVFAAIGDNRIDLVDRLVAATQRHYSFYSTTPLGFFQDEVTLFWPLLIQQLDLKAQFPLRLNPENEQELAARLWQPEIDRVIGAQAGVNEARLVRKILDLLQLAALAGIPADDIPILLQQGLVEQDGELPIPFETVGTMLQQWQQWCLERGLLTYGITAGLYWQYLLKHPTYESHLVQRYPLILADDVDEYPAIARHLFEKLLNAGVSAAFTFNPDGAVRLGLGADPTYLAELAKQCEVVELSDRPTPSLLDDLGESLVEFAINPMIFLALPESIQSIQTVSRSDLLRQTAETIIAAVQSRQVEPRNIAVISPGLDAIARYALIDILTKHQIPVESLNDQRPLISFAIVRALLTLLALVYPGLGRLVDRDAIAEMLVVLGNQGQIIDSRSAPSPSTHSTLAIDPVRAGLLADYCFAPHPDRPRLLPATTFPRWDRLGYQTSEAYQAVIQWIETQQSQLEQRLIPNAVSLLDRAIQHFLSGGSSLAFDQLSALRQLLETAQHYWEIADRLRRSTVTPSDRGTTRQEAPAAATISQFIQLLRNSAVTANPYPVRPLGAASNAVTLATVFQYRSSRRVHRWQFWLDAASPRWLSGVDALFAAPLFLQNWSGGLWTAADAMDANEQRLRRILLDLQARTEERIYLCHSDLATNGQEQTGTLLTLVNAATPITTV